MSVSMDDLCASLSSSHVGQEAMDLAALQVQLAQTLFCQSMASSSNESGAQPCNTPTGRTPSASFSWSPMAMVDQSRPPMTPRRTTDEHVRDEMEEDERMVEDLLIPTSPVSSPHVGEAPDSGVKPFAADFLIPRLTRYIPFHDPGPVLHCAVTGCAELRCLPPICLLPDSLPLSAIPIYDALQLPASQPRAEPSLSRHALAPGGGDVLIRPIGETGTQHPDITSFLSSRCTRRSPIMISCGRTPFHSLRTNDHLSLILRTFCNLRHFGGHLCLRRRSPPSIIGQAPNLN
ncbi:hypothetical protein MVEN_02415700 [Mycena venus]|uniref:Uncharacterized protein n=1 Tax=Mycena venus TaxID=2733690 RepID=A0A8H6WY00_9AGAR|nr:hypothetical protein MVEN_02415700 [Mycena venus]